jgi:hypothetical protein
MESLYHRKNNRNGAEVFALPNYVAFTSQERERLHLLSDRFSGVRVLH